MIVAKLKSKNIENKLSDLTVLNNFCESLGFDIDKFRELDGLNIGNMTLSIFFEMFYMLNTFGGDITDFIDISYGEITVATYKNGEETRVNIPMFEERILEKILSGDIKNEELIDYLYQLLDGVDINADRIDFLLIPYVVCGTGKNIDIEFKDENDLKEKTVFARALFNEDGLKIETFL